MPDLMEGLDVLAALKGTDQVLMDTVMQPEVVERQMQQINDIYFQVFDELYDIIREGDEMAFCYFSLWAPGKTTKLQSDISTMISTDDYRRFVLPFIREQCQRIDYTLYHLDGVGAMHHLPALLEIDELNAIQWTPGVGQPQGGNAKWYDMYRRILDAGKSIMCCWVTLDELRPLLDNIGCEGVHLEMDFHNEQEVEKAMGIVDDFKNARNLHPASIRDIARQDSPYNRILVLDGAMGTMIQQYHLAEESFRGCLFASHHKKLQGCNDVLSLTSPSVISDIHRKYLMAGADIIETNTFNAQRISLADYGLEAHVRDINLAAASLARQCADEFSSSGKKRFVAGSIGPTSRITSSACTDTPLSKEELRSAYSEQIQALSDGGVDFLLIETIFDVENARIAIEAAHAVAPHIPLMLSFSIATPDGYNMLGQSIIAFLETIDTRALFSIGINCLSDVPQITPFVLRLSQFGTRVSLYPNAGMPDAQGRYTKTPESLLADVWPLLEGHHLNIIGGCCGTTDNHIRLMAKAIEPVQGIRLSPLSLEYKNSKQDEAVARSASPLGSSKNSVIHDAVADSKLYTLHSKLSQAIISGNADAAKAATEEAIAAGAMPQALINDEMIVAMSEIGQMFEDGKAFVPQLLMAGRAMKAALELLKPMMAGKDSTAIGKVVIGTVKGDLHDIGKNLVASMLEGCGFEVVNIGIDVSADKFIEAVKENQADILCMSALLTTTMGYMKEVIDALDKAGIRDKVKVMVGGAPVTQHFADDIGADGYSDNANSAVALAKHLMKKEC
jgi:corrinoid protein of di/trimethylamine methyltransferase